MIPCWARPVPTRLWVRCHRQAFHTGTAYRTSASRNADTASRTTADDLLILQDTKKVFRGGNNTSEHAVQQLGLTPLGRERAARSKATWEHASDRTFIDMYPGLGGFHYAFRRHDFRLLCAIEHDPQNAEVYKRNFRGAKVKIGGLTPGIIPHFASVLCLPCHGTEEPVLFQMLQLVASKPSQRRPLIMILEHAVSFVTIDQDKRPTGDFAKLQAQLSDMGYRLQWRIYEASRFGLPLQRDRLFMVAVKESYSQAPFEFPNSPYTDAQADEITVRSILENQTSKSLEKLLYRGSGEMYWKDAPETVRNVSRMGHYLEPGPQGKLRRYAIFSDLGHVPTVDPDAPFFVRTPGSEKSNFGPTIPSSRGLSRPSAHDENGNSTIIRRLTSRELARLYGFSEDMQLWSEQELAWRHIANSVSPRITEALASAIVVQYFTGPQKRPKAYWDGAKDADLPLMRDLLKRLEGEVHLLRRDLSLAKEQVVGHNGELRELKRKLQEMETSRT